MDLVFFIVFEKEIIFNGHKKGVFEMMLDNT